MLKPVSTQTTEVGGGRFAIVASNYNSQSVDAMVEGAQRTLANAGVELIKVVRVPGAYEIPVTVARLADNPSRPFSACICLGVILRGETAHAQLIGESVTAALMQIQLQVGLPIAHEVLLLENEEQARKRCLDPEHNRGIEAAQTALEMARIIRELKPD